MSLSLLRMLLRYNTNHWQLSTSAKQASPPGANFGYHLITITKVIVFKPICKSGSPITFLSVAYLANQATTWI